ncbi:hypothetical protein Q5752_000855 [Cryptotrichosporon argae]
MPSAARKGKGREVAAPKTEAALPLGKQLAHTDKKVRDQAVRNLAAFLSRGAGEAEGSGYVRLSDAEMAKLWKGLFYCFWMSDKPLVQQALATELSSLLLSISPAPSRADLGAAEREAERFAASLAFLEGFWAAIIREWNGIDRLRMDKFLMLLRRWTNATLRLLARSEWSAASVRAINAVYSAPSGPLTWQDVRVPSSIATHLADVFLTELSSVLSSSMSAPCPLPLLLEPFTLLLARTSSSRVHDRLMSVLYTPLLASLSAGSDADAATSVGAGEGGRPDKRQKVEVYAIDNCAAADSQAQPDTSAAVRKAVLVSMFRAAADERAIESNRRKMYRIWREEGGDDDDE